MVKRKKQRKKKNNNRLFFGIIILLIIGVGAFFLFVEGDEKYGGACKGITYLSFTIPTNIDTLDFESKIEKNIESGSSNEVIKDKGCIEFERIEKINEGDNIQVKFIGICKVTQFNIDQGFSCEDVGGEGEYLPLN